MAPSQTKGSSPHWRVSGPILLPGWPGSFDFQSVATLFFFSLSFGVEFLFVFSLFAASRLVGYCKKSLLHRNRNMSKKSGEPSCPINQSSHSLRPMASCSFCDKTRRLARLARAAASWITIAVNDACDNSLASGAVDDLGIFVCAAQVRGSNIRVQLSLTMFTKAG